MPIIEEINDSTTEGHTQSEAQTPFAEWIVARLAAGVAGVDLVQEIGAQDHVGANVSDAEAIHRLQLFASHPEVGPKACEFIRARCRKLRKKPPFPFATWLKEREVNAATASQVVRMLGMKPSSTVDESVTVLEDFESENKERVLLNQGLHGSVKRYDDEGDALIEFDGIEKPQWVFQRDFSKLKFAELGSRWKGLLKLAQDENAWDIVAGMVASSNLQEQPPRKNIARIENFEAVAQLIAKSHRVLVLAGAGISVACGLPTFRDDDVRPAIAREFGLDFADDVSDIATFRNDPRPWFKWIRELIPSAARPVQPSLTHRFVRSLEERGQLLRMYTQNIDTLEQAAGIMNVIHCHGSFATATCIMCGDQVLDATSVNEAIAADGIPRCTVCGEGVMKPDVVLFGEPMPSGVMQGLDEDTAAADLLLVLGTSLSVTPCSLMPSLVGASGDAPRVLINREKVGKDSDFECFLPGACDDVIQVLLQHLAWENEPMLVE